MERNEYLTVKERARTTEIQDSLMTNTWNKKRRFKRETDAVR